MYDVHKGQYQVRKQVYISYCDDARWNCELATIMTVRIDQGRLSCVAACKSDGGNESQGLRVEYWKSCNPKLVSSRFVCGDEAVSVLSIPVLQWTADLSSLPHTICFQNTRSSSYKITNIHPTVSRGRSSHLSEDSFYPPVCFSDLFLVFCIYYFRDRENFLFSTTICSAQPHSQQTRLGNVICYQLIQRHMAEPQTCLRPQSSYWRMGSSCRERHTVTIPMILC